MTNVEMIEKLSQKAGVTKDIAEEALKESGWDILDAMIYLEKCKNANDVTAARGYSSANKTEHIPKEEYPKREDITANRYVNRVIAWGLDNSIIISQNEVRIVELPIVFFILILIVSFSLIIVLMIVGLFFNFQYSFAGPQLGNKHINCAMRKLYDVAQSIKQSSKNR